MEKRGQVTIFVVIGLLILIVLSVVFVIISTRNRVAESEITASTLDEVRRQVNLDVKLCFENIVEAGILDGARHGGETILWNQIYISNVNPCEMMPTATQEIKLMYGPDLGDDCSLMVKKTPTSGPYPITNPDEAKELYFDFKKKLPPSYDPTPLQNYIIDKLPKCIKLDKYITKGWKISSSEKNWKYTDTNSLTQYLQDHNEAITVITQSPPPTCPLDGKFIVKLNMPIVFSKESRIDKEESFVLDNQEFIYNADLTYFYKQVNDLLTRLIRLYSDDPNRIKIKNVPTQEICTNCMRLGTEIDLFKQNIENTCGDIPDGNGCHFYKATDPNSGAYFFNIKCGEYYFKPSPDTSSTKTINGKSIILLSKYEGDPLTEEDDKVQVEVERSQSEVKIRETVNIGGLDVTYTKNRPGPNNEVVLLVGKGVSFLWGYHFGCMPPAQSSTTCQI